LAPFTGQNTVDFSGVDTTFATTVTEPFRLLSLPLELSVVATVASFCAGHLLKYQTPGGQIDAISASRILAPPAFLVVQLKLFAYNSVTRTRSKVYSPVAY
jgi:hypothetical protein